MCIFHSNSNTPTPTPTPTTIPVGCTDPTTILDVQLQAALDTDLPKGPTLCLAAALGTQTVSVIGGSVPTASRGNPATNVGADIASVGPGGIPVTIPLTATTVCVALSPV